MVLSEILHELGARIRRMRRDEKVHVIRHQTICMHRAAVFERELAQVAEVRAIVRFLEEARAPVMTTLRDVEADPGHNETRRSRHKTGNDADGRMVDR